MLNVTQTNVTGTGAVTIVPASGAAGDAPRHIKALVLSTLNAAAATITIKDGTVTKMVLNLPASATVPLAPVVVAAPLPQSVGNTAWTATVSVNAAGVQVTAVWSDDPRDIV